LSRDDSFGEFGVLARCGRFVHRADASCLRRYAVRPATRKLTARSRARLR
jgi:hypothetical protein